MSLGKIGSFELRQKLGQGGMGEVFLATDTRLGRDVALKLLPDSFAQDPARMARFEREARLLASLNHPNIATIHGIEESDGKRALVMELVPGEDLSERIAREPLALTEALSIALQIARALEAAHGRGVVHRDLKPANVRLTPDGQVKVLDFGLAKTMEGEVASGPAPANSPTLSIQATQLGLVLGTAGYMSPEQARGKPVDGRSDVFSFGCVLFEMFARERAFTGEDISELLASVIKNDVRWERLPRSVPEPVRKLLARCLAGKAEDRYQAIGDVRYELAAFLADPSTLAPVGSAAQDSGARGPSRMLVIALVGIALVAGAAAAWSFRPATRAPSLRLLKFTVDVPEGAEQALISPDGGRLATGGRGDVWVRRLDQLALVKLSLPWPAVPVAWTLDSRTLIVRRDNQANGELWKVSMSGGEPQSIGPLPDAGFPWGVSPLDEQTLLIGMATGGLFTKALMGGETKPLLAPAEGKALTGPSVLPGGKAIVYGEAESGTIELLEGGKRRQIVKLDGDRIFDPVYSPPGYLLFRLASGKRARGIWAVPFSVDRLAVTGPPFQVAPYGQVSVSAEGLLVYRETALDATPRRLVWVDRGGKVVGAIGETVNGLVNPALSPDGSRIVASGLTDDQNRDLYVFDARTGARYPLRDDIGNERYPFWRDNRTIGFVTHSAGMRHLKERDLDGGGAPRTLYRAAVVARGSLDGRFTLVSYRGLGYLERGSDVRRPLAELDLGIYDADLSPDNKLIAYTRHRGEGLFVRPFPEGGSLSPVTSGDVGMPRFSRDGKELFYWSDDKFMAVSIEGAGIGARVGAPRVLFSAAPEKLSPNSEFDVAADGRFLMLQSVGDDAAAAPLPSITFVQNWSAEFAAP